MMRARPIKIIAVMVVTAANEPAGQARHDKGGFVKLTKRLISRDIVAVAGRAATMEPTRVGRWSDPQRKSR